MAWPQFIVLGLLLVGVGSAMAKYGKPKTDSYDMTDILIAPAIMFFLLWSGNFWEAGAKFW